MEGKGTIKIAQISLELLHVINYFPKILYRSVDLAYLDFLRQTKIHPKTKLCHNLQLTLCSLSFR